MIKNSLVKKLWLHVVVMVILILTGLGFVVTRLFNKIYLDHQVDELANHGQVIAMLVGSEKNPEHIEGKISFLAQSTEYDICIVDKDGKIIYKTHKGSGKEDLLPEEKASLERGEKIVERGYHHTEKDMITVGVPNIQAGQLKGSVLIHTPSHYVESITDILSSVLFYGILITILIGSVLAYVLSNFFTKPLIRMNRIALAMAGGDFRQRVEVKTKDEVGLLANNLNKLSCQLEQTLVSLSKEKNNLENLLLNMTDGVVAFDIAGNMSVFNKPIVTILDKNCNLNITNEMTVYDLPVDMLEAYNSVASSQKLQREIITLGQRKYDLKVVPIFLSSGEMANIMMVLQDVTKEKELEKIRHDFVANVSHELRTPLTLIEGYSQAIKDGFAKNKEIKDRYLDTILSEANRIKRLVLEVLDLHTIENGYGTLEISKINLSELTQTVIDKFHLKAHEAGVIMSLEVPEQPVFINADIDRVEQILINLIDNAFQSLDNKELNKIDIKVYIELDIVILEVVDNGRGIPERELPFIWERFYKVDKSRTKDKRSGTGLGLAIVKSIVEANQGEITVTSVFDLGTTFKIKFPKA